MGEAGENLKDHERKELDQERCHKFYVEDGWYRLEGTQRVHCLLMLWNAGLLYITHKAYNSAILRTLEHQELR
uniref:Uncharacterized protein n=1 Tax=Tanacetum cinerariifolium TaxID=118510 RepID=A0A6L2NQ39_TANCI|nr:hypothetical protein [Tanacetum cinerariifolium]